MRFPLRKPFPGLVLAQEDLSDLVHRGGDWEKLGAGKRVSVQVMVKVLGDKMHAASGSRHQGYLWGNGERRSKRKGLHCRSNAAEAAGFPSLQTCTTQSRSLWKICSQKL